MTDELQTWHESLQHALGERRGSLKRIFVMRETDSTQDAARRMNAAPGDVIVAGKQNKGRGRRGRSWSDERGQGIAVTIALERQSAPEMLAITAAVATARAAESILSRPVGIKWPNDLMVDRRKLAGVLIEQFADRALIGIGLNVGQREWPPALQGLAVSMAELGSSASRLDIMAVLLSELNDALARPADETIAGFVERDALRGKPASFHSGGAIISGLVTAIDPAKGLCVTTDRGEMWLSAATTSVIKAHADVCGSER